MIKLLEKLSKVRYNFFSFLISYASVQVEWNYITPFLTGAVKQCSSVPVNVWDKFCPNQFFLLKILFHSNFSCVPGKNGQKKSKISERIEYTKIVYMCKNSKRMSGKNSVRVLSNSFLNVRPKIVKLCSIIVCVVFWLSPHPLFRLYFEWWTNILHYLIMTQW